MRRAPALALSLALLAVGCGGSFQPVGAFLDDGFHPIGDQYRVRYQRHRFLLPYRWRLTNYSDPVMHRGLARQGEEHFSYHGFVGGDPSRRIPAARMPRADLYFSALRSELWCRSLVVDDRWAQRPLVDLLLASLAERRTAPSVFGRRLLTPRTSRFVADESRFAFVGGRRGSAVFFREVRSGRPDRRGVIMIVDTQRTYDTTHRSFPLTLVIGLLAEPAVWDESLADFEDLVRRVDFRPGERP